MSDTPETDEHDQDHNISGYTLDFCRKLERERDEWQINALLKLAFKQLACMWCGEIVHAPAGYEPGTPLNKDLRGQAYREHVATCAKHPIRDVERERDEAREQLSIALAEIDRLDVAGIHSCHSECERANCVLRRELTTITAQRDNCQLELQIVIERLKGNRHPDDNGMKYEGEIDIKTMTEQRDRLAVALEQILSYQGRFAEEDPESIATRALQSLTTTKQ
jgi:hypothetical protein